MASCNGQKRRGMNLVLSRRMRLKQYNGHTLSEAFSTLDGSTDYYCTIIPSQQLMHCYSDSQSTMNSCSGFVID